MKPIFKKLENLINAIKIKHKAMPFANIDDQIEKDIQKERIKKFVSRKYIFRSNIEKLYGLLWGQFSSALQAIIK